MVGYVTVYTTGTGLENFIITGSCTAKATAYEDWKFPLIVPREGIKNFTLDNTKQFSVDVRSSAIGYE